MAAGNSRSVPMGVGGRADQAAGRNGYHEVVLTGVDLTYGAPTCRARRAGQSGARSCGTSPDLPQLRISSIDSIEAMRR
jgi:threonylcarbamoyladenosine tRNA methylthiotransferase MtaB